MMLPTSPAPEIMSHRSTAKAAEMSTVPWSGTQRPSSRVLVPSNFLQRSVHLKAKSLLFAVI